MQADQSWMKSPPFRWKDAPSVMAEGKYALICFCKRVQFVLTANPLDVKVCHCDNCKVLHGAPMQTAAIFNKTDVCLIKGEEGEISFLRSSDSDPHLTTHSTDCPRKIYCTACGSPLADEGRRMLMVFPSSLRPFQTGIQVQKRDIPNIGSLYELPIEFRIRKHIFYSRRSFDIMDGIEKWEGLDGKSRRMRDDGTIVTEE